MPQSNTQSDFDFMHSNDSNNGFVVEAGHNIVQPLLACCSESFMKNMRGRGTNLRLIIKQKFNFRSRSCY